MLAVKYRSGTRDRVLCRSQFPNVVIGLLSAEHHFQPKMNVIDNQVAVNKMIFEATLADVALIQLNR